MGDSLTAGEENDSLLDSLQAHSYPSLIAHQANFALVQPLIAPPGFPAELQLVQGSFPFSLAPASGTSAGRENPAAQINNLAVPAQTVSNLISMVPVANPGTLVQTFTNLVLGYPAGSTNSQMQQAVALNPTAVFLWIGANDILGADGYGDPSSVTAPSDFASEFTQVIATLKAKTTAQLIVANLPDFTLIPFMTPADLLAQEIAGATGCSAPQIEQDLGLASGDLVNAAGLSIVTSELNPISAGEMPAALPGNAVLTAEEVIQVQHTLAAYNQTIAQQTAAAGGTLVDLYSYFNSLRSGISINGTTATLGFLGGIFSIDGVHPTQTGYALIANQFIAGANTALGLSIPPVDVGAVAATDPLFGPNLPSLGRPRFIYPGAARAISSLLLATGP